MDGMAEVHRIIDLSTRVMEGDAWHAGSIAALLEDVTLQEATAHPVPGAHSIWELVLHLTAWADEVRARVEGADAGEPAAGDWPALGRMTEVRWNAAKAALLEAYRELGSVLKTIPDDFLRHPVADRRDAEAGTGLSRWLTVHGAIHHAVYHSGQIALLKRALRAR